MADAILIGECMVELGLDGAGQAAVGYGGDTFNTAVYLSRLGVRASYATAVGRGDPFSAGILDLMAAEGIGPELVVQAPGRLPGLYAIHRDSAGERSFYYWREQSPARDYMALADGAALQAALDGAKIIYLSAITLAVLGEGGRADLMSRLLQATQAGAGLMLDTNYRVPLWPDAGVAREAIEALAPRCRFISAGEQDLRGLGLDPEAAALGWAGHGAEVVLRREDRHVEVFDQVRRSLFTPEPPVAAVDTTGAGDSFNAAYLAARLAGEGIATAVARARSLAVRVVQHRGAIIPRDL